MKESTMKKILSCRRSIVSIFAIACLTFLGAYHGVDISGIALAIAGIAGSLSGANAFEASKTKTKQSVDSPD
jgi:hypothetical protein